MKEIKGTDVGLSGIEQIKIAIKAIDKYSGKAQMSNIYEVFEEHIYPNKLSRQGKASLRFFVNEVAVKEGYIYPHDPKNKGWRATQKGYQMIGKATTKTNKLKQSQRDIKKRPRWVTVESIKPEITQEVFVSHTTIYLLCSLLLTNVAILSLLLYSFFR